MLPPLGIIFGLLVAFLAAQAWGDLDRVHAAVNREASALRTVAHDRPFIGPTAVQPTALLQVQPDPADARR